MACNSLNVARKDKVSSETQGRLLTMSYCEIEVQLTYFQYLMVQSKHPHSKREEWKRESQDQSKTKIHRGKIKPCHCTSSAGARDGITRAPTSLPHPSPCSSAMCATHDSLFVWQPWWISPTFCHLYWNPSFIFPASHNGLSKLLFGESTLSPTTWHQPLSGTLVRVFMLLPYWHLLCVE